MAEAGQPRLFRDRYSSQGERGLGFDAGQPVLAHHLATREGPHLGQWAGIAGRAFDDSAASPCSVISLRGAVVLVEETTKDDQRVPLDLLLAVSAGWLMLYWSVRAMRIAFASRLDVRPGQAVGVGGCRGICKFIKVARARTLAK